MRLKNGDFIDVVDGKGTRIMLLYIKQIKISVQCKVEGIVFERPKKHLHLVQALAKADRDEQAVESCVESNSNRYALKASRCVSVWNDKNNQKLYLNGVLVAATKHRDKVLADCKE